jgi:hypothetical protein
LTVAVTPAERRLLKMLLDADELRERLAGEIARDELHRGLETEKLFAALLAAGVPSNGSAEELTTLGERLEERDRRLLFDLAFEAAAEPSWEEAESCLAVLRRRQFEAELRAVQAEIEALKNQGTGSGAGGKAELLRLLEKKQTLRASLDRLEG